MWRRRSLRRRGRSTKTWEMSPWRRCDSPEARRPSRRGRRRRPPPRPPCGRRMRRYPLRKRIRSLRRRRRRRRLRRLRWNTTRRNRGTSRHRRGRTGLQQLGFRRVVELAAAAATAAAASVAAIVAVCVVAGNEMKTFPIQGIPSDSELPLIRTITFGYVLNLTFSIQVYPPKCRVFAVLSVLSRRTKEWRPSEKCFASALFEASSRIVFLGPSPSRVLSSQGPPYLVL